ncbi:MAG: F0F1 ATP synthase subunit B [Pirellulaceae bacterium]
MSKHLLILAFACFFLPCLLSGPASAVQVGDEHAEPAAEHAGDGEHAQRPPLLNLDLGSAVWNLLIFLLTFAVLAFLVWPPILKGLQSREDKIRSDLKQAEAANANAANLLTQYEKKLDDAQAEVQAMLAEARKDAAAAGERIVADAKAEAGRQRDRAVADIETAKQVALTEMADQTSAIAMKLAQQVVGRELRPEDHADLIRQSLDRLPSHN